MKGQLVKYSEVESSDYWLLVGCPSVCLSVCPVRNRNLKTKRCGKIKIGRTSSQGRSTCVL